ncbi:hypothetical protein MferCBS31731_003499 [Microsporum ferrugineum]
MARPTHLLTTSFLYPTGNTPAVCLTHSLPPDQDVSLLLLGCGDVRNVLFTAYSDLGSGNRKVDVTCCDLEAEIIARNMLLYTLILDNPNNENVKHIWNIYNDVLINTTALGLLQAQAKKLVENTHNIADWNNGKYGKILRFCTNASFLQVMHLWKFYALDPSDEQAFKHQQRELKLATQKAKELQSQIIGESMVGTGWRSAAPCNFREAEECSKFYEQFWKEGTTIPNVKSTVKALYMNPMFGTQNKRKVLHYGTQPLLGYHLATAYTPITEGSPLNYVSDDLGDAPTAVRAAFAQFCAYAKAFRTVSTQWVVRFVCADALVFCHTLQGVGAYGMEIRPEQYCHNWSFEPFILDSHEYSDQRGGAPTSFDLIDTSNLVDHLGALNVLTAASPLLKPKPTSTICTELLVLRHKNTDQYVKSLLSGDMITIGLLFKLTPLQYWTGASVSSNLTERILGDETGSQARYIVRWTRVVADPIALEPKQLSRLIYQMYLSIFKDENPMNLLKLNEERALRVEYTTYTRASFCFILELMQKSNIVDWPAFISACCDLITEDSNLLMGAHYLQGFYLHLYLSGLHTMPNFAPDLGGRIVELPNSPFKGWTTIPPILSITLVIPREKLALFGDSPVQKYGTPACHIMLESQGGQSIFPDVQLSFGRIQTSGMKFTENYALEINVDEGGWDGTSPLIASVMVPTSVILLTPSLATEVSFGLKTTPVTLKLLKDLGMNLKIHESTVRGSDVFITKHRPNMTGDIPLRSREVSINPPNLPGCMEGTDLKFHVLLDPENSKAISLTSRVDITRPSYQDILRKGAEVLVEQSSPYKITIKLRGEPFHLNINLPLPIQMVNTKTRVARKSSYIEFIAPIASPGSLARYTDNVFPIEVYENIPILRNLDYTALDRLPIIDLRNKSKLMWLKLLLTDMFSARELDLRKKHLTSSDCGDVRVNFKESLNTLFGYFSGVGVQSRCTVFGLDNEASGGVNVLIFISCLRLEASNQSVVLDGAVVPLTMELVPKIRSALSDLVERGMRTVRVDDDELLLWKHTLPAFVERCRTWKHLPSCEYRSTGKIPLSLGFAQPVLCSCGQGKFPSDYGINDCPGWKDIKKYAVRVAISPCYSVPFVEEGFMPGMANKDTTTPGISQTMKTLAVKEEACSNCGGTKPGSGTKLLRCSGCKVTKYCSKECQREDWRLKHKLACKMQAQLN